MNNKYPVVNEDEPNEKSMIQVIEHLVFRDAETGNIIMNKRQVGNERTK